MELLLLLLFTIIIIAEIISLTVTLYRKAKGIERKPWYLFKIDKEVWD